MYTRWEWRAVRQHAGDARTLKLFDRVRHRIFLRARKDNFEQSQRRHAPVFRGGGETCVDHIEDARIGEISRNVTHQRRQPRQEDRPGATGHKHAPQERVVEDYRSLCHFLSSPAHRSRRSRASFGAAGAASTPGSRGRSSGAARAW